MPTFPNEIQFHGQWRPYQQRIMDNMQSCLADKKLHIVAAPGSGKTTVGLAVIVKLNQPALILSPSITIREQWIQRFCSGFLPNGEAPQKWVSNSMKSPKPITAVTYQALHSAYTKLCGDAEEDDEESSDKETADYSDFDLIQTLKASGIKTICLDEAHHLRSEWWKSLEKVLEELGTSIVTVSLTATPPYDAKPAEWQRYMNLCGEIDMEIFTPELVKDHNLCPHQDYIYFNWPNKDEIDQIKAFKESGYDMAFKIAEDPNFVKAVCSHKGLLQIDTYTELFLEHPNYLTAMTVFLHHHEIPFSKELKKLIGTSAKLPKLDVQWMEILLQGFLYFDCESYQNCEALQENLRKKLSAGGHIYRKNIIFTNSDDINKLLISSKGKLNSIKEIVHAEYQTLGEHLRMLILTDYIKKDALTLIGNPNEDIHSIGTVPIFELLRREEILGLKLGVLSGSIVIVPNCAKNALNQLGKEKNLELSCKELPCTEYSEVNFSGSNRKQMVSIITELFSMGEIHTLVGTKSLLGEGWDSPCVNTLILASFVGSYMLSNQMRGRAIRVCPGVPDKTANIWHLVSMEPLWAYSSKMTAQVIQSVGNREKNADYPVSEDFDTMRRRFQSFLGVGYTEDVIQDGIERLSIIQPPYDRKNMDEINREMLKMAADRASLRERWETAIEQCPDVAQVIERNQIEKELIPRKFAFFNAVAYLGISTASQGFLYFLLRAVTALHASNTQNSICVAVLIALMIVIWIVMIRQITHIYHHFSPASSLKLLGNSVLKALKQIGVVESYNTKVVTNHADEFTTICYLDGGTTYEKNIFSDCISQMLGGIDNPRYLLVQRNKFLFFFHSTEYYSVPEIFGNKKENATIFEQCLTRFAGDCKLVFTRNVEGRKVLLNARTKSFVNKNDRLINRNHKVKSEWE